MISEPRYCPETGCLRQVLRPYIYCSKHQDYTSDPYVTKRAEIEARLDELQVLLNYKGVSRMVSTAVEELSTVLRGQLEILEQMGK